MGYRPPKTVYKLVFADEDMNGLEVRAHSISIGKLLSLAGLKQQLDANNPDPALVSQTFEVFAKALVSWNVEDDDGRPVPATLEGLYTQDLGFVMRIIQAWMEVVADVPLPLGKPSNVGSQYPAVSIPMATLSPNLTS